MFSKTQVKVLLILLDERGHPEWELAKILEMKESNLNPILNKLQDLDVIYQEMRKSSRKNDERTKEDRKYKEYPYYISKKLESLGTIIKEIKSTKSPKKIDPGFFIWVLSVSNYAKTMKNVFGKKSFINTIIDGLAETYDFYKDKIFEGLVSSTLDIDMISPDTNFEKLLKNEFTAQRSRLYQPSEIEIWYRSYVLQNPS